MATVKTIRGQREYPTKLEYVQACQQQARNRMQSMRRDGWGERETSIAEEAAIARSASEHYDSVTVRGETLRRPETY